MKDKALLKMLKDFPMLWAIRQWWSPKDMHVTAGYAVANTILKEFHEMWAYIEGGACNYEIWIYETGYQKQKDGWVQKLYKLKPRPEISKHQSIRKTLKILLQQKIMMGGEIEYIFFERVNSINIYRPHQAYKNFNNIFIEIIALSSE